MERPLTNPEGECHAVECKLHPRTKFMIVVPGTILVMLVIIVLFAPHAGKAGTLRGLAAMMAVVLAAVAAAWWDQRARYVRWNDYGIYLGQVSRFGIVRGRHVTIAFETVDRVELAGMPGGVTPTLPRIAIVTKAVRNERFIIDPNYYNAGSLLVFFRALGELAPHVKSANKGVPFHRVISRLERAL